MHWQLRREKCSAAPSRQPAPAPSPPRLRASARCSCTPHLVRHRSVKSCCSTKWTTSRSAVYRARMYASGAPAYAQPCVRRTRARRAPPPQAHSTTRSGCEDLLLCGAARGAARLASQLNAAFARASTVRRARDGGARLAAAAGDEAGCAHGARAAAAPPDLGMAECPPGARLALPPAPWVPEPFDASRRGAHPPGRGPHVAGRHAARRDDHLRGVASESRQPPALCARWAALGGTYIAYYQRPADLRECDS